MAVIAITAMQLANVTALRDLLNQKVCLASANPTNLGVCTYIYAVGGVSLVFTIAIGLLQLVRLHQTRVFSQINSLMKL